MKLIFFICFCIFIYADSFDDKVNKYFIKIKDSKPSSIQNLNNLKMIYLDTILSENDARRFKVLAKLLKASSIVGFNPPSSYQSEFDRLSKKIKPKVLRKKKIPTKKKSKKLKVQTSKKLNQLIYAKKINNIVHLKWKKKINKKNIKYSTWKDGRFFYHLYDIKKSNLDMNTKEFAFKNSFIKIGQYDNNTVRLVFKSSKKRKVIFTTQGKTIKMSFKKTSKKKIQKKKKTANIPEYTIAYKNNNFKNKIIIIDPGHGGKDPGALGEKLRGKKIKEKDIVLKVSKYLVSYLKEMGLKVYITRNRDKFIPLKYRTKIANKKQADLFVSIHVNATKNKKVQGIETYFLSPKSSAKSQRVALRENSLDAKSLNALSKNVLLNIVNRSKLLQSNKLAIDIQRNLLITTKLNSYNIKDHGVRGGPFWVLVGARMPNVLVELGYLTNRSEAKRLMSTKYQKTLAKGIARGIEAYLEKN